MSGEIRFDRLTKSFGEIRAVDDLSVMVRPGAVTGFLGPNGAGKTTTLRILLGLVEPTSGSATIDGSRYGDLSVPARRVGAALEAASFHPGRTARNHLRMFAPQVGVSDQRCDEVLEAVGLTDAARRRVGGFSMGMRQRLALATTLLGDPDVLVLDEPANGLDPEGIKWLRLLLRHLAGEGKTILVSSHMLPEIQQTVDDVVIIAGGRLVHSSSISELAALAGYQARLVTPDREGLDRLVAEHQWRLLDQADGSVLVDSVTAAEVGAAAFASQLEVHALSDRAVDLEQVFFDLTEQGANVKGAAV